MQGPSNSISSIERLIIHSMTFNSPFARVLRNAAPNLSRRFFDCRHCSSTTAHLARKTRRAPPCPSRFLNPSVSRTKRFASILIASETAGTTQATVKKASSFPETSSNAVAYWLLGSAASVFGIVVFGGWTRLTESGYCTTFKMLREFADRLCAV